jgi:hypothetical protein
VLEWYNPAQRVVYWNKFSMPPWGTSRISDSDDMFMTWWVDPQKEAELAAAKADPAKKLDVPEVEFRFWPEYRKAEEAKRAAAPPAPAPAAASAP